MQLVIRLNDGPPLAMPQRDDHEVMIDQGFKMVRTYVRLMEGAEPPIREFKISMEFVL